jgi:hypothetical protein
LRRIDWPFLAVFALAAWLLLPLLATGYTGDDEINSLVPGILRFHRASLAHLIGNVTWGWMKTGRFYPLSFVEVYTVFYVFPSLLAFKGFVLASVLVNLWTVHLLVRRVTGNRDFALAVVLFTAGLFQFRFCDDPILGYSGLLQMVWLAMTLSLYALWRHLESANRGWLALAVGAYAAAALTYEVAYCLIVAHALLILRAQGRRRLAGRLLPFALVLLVGVATVMVLRQKYEPPAVYRPNRDLRAFLVTLGRQTHAALPLSSRLALPYFPKWPAALRSSPLTLVLCLALSALVLLRLARGDLGLRGHGPTLAVAAAWLWVAPGAPIATSPKYQALIHPGLGYLPVYISYFGVGILAVWLFTLLLARLRHSGRPTAPAALVAAVGLAMVLTITWSANRQLAAEHTRDRHRRATLEEALRAGLLEGVPDGSALLIGPDSSHYHQVFSPYFYAFHAGKRLNAYSTRWTAGKGFPLLGVAFLPDSRGLPPRLEDVGAAPGEVYEVKTACPNDRQGFVLLSKLAAEPFSGKAPEAARITHHVRLFAREDNRPEGESPSFYLRGERPGGSDPFFIPSTALTPVDRGGGWTLYEYDASGRLVDPASLGVIAIERGVGVSWGDAFYTTTEDPDPHHWCSTRSGELILFQPGDQPRTYRLSFSLQTVDQRTVVIDGPAFHEVVRAGPERVFLSKRVVLPPGELRIAVTSREDHSPAPSDPRGFFFRIGDFELTRENE